MDVAEIIKTHVNIKKADKDYKTETFEQQRRIEEREEQLEKLEARRKLAETRHISDLEALRSEHSMLKRSLQTLKKLCEESERRSSEMMSWLQVLCTQRLEKVSKVMLTAHCGRLLRHRAPRTAH